MSMYMDMDMYVYVHMYYILCLGSNPGFPRFSELSTIAHFLLINIRFLSRFAVQHF